MYIMAKTIMISNEVYGRLKGLKERKNESFSEVILDCLEESRKTGAGLKECFGILRGDKEYDKIMKETKKRWDRWTKQYA